MYLLQEGSIICECVYLFISLYINIYRHIHSYRYKERQTGEKESERALEICIIQNNEL